MTVPTSGTSTGRSRWTAKAGTFSKVMDVAFPSRTAARDADQAGGRLEDEARDRLGDRHQALVDEHGRGADRVRAAHGRVLGLLHDHEARIGLRGGRRQDEVAAGRRIAARLAKHQSAQMVALLGQVVALLEHRRARHLGHATDDDPARLSAGVRVHGADDPVQLHHGMVAQAVARTRRGVPSAPCDLG